VVTCCGAESGPRLASSPIPRSVFGTRRLWCVPLGVAHLAFLFGRRTALLVRGLWVVGVLPL
jgi:hypothetical protein